MTAAHFIADDLGEDLVVLRGEEARHASRVLRIRRGETITIGDGRGTVVAARVREVGAEVVAEPLERRTVEPVRPRLVVWQAIATGTKLDLVVQKLTEVGAAEVVPFAARRSVARWDAGKAVARVEHLRAVAREAAKQSRRAWLMEVAGPRPLGEIPAGALALHEEAGRRLREELPETIPEAVVLVVGPEGGLAPEELDALSGRRAVPVSLGGHVLRTETAALVASVAVLTRYGVVG